MKKETTSGFDPGDDEVVIEKLRKWDGGSLSSGLFTEIARIIPQPIVEIVVLRENEGRVEALLIPRPANDPIWPGMVHTPGVALRVADFRRPDGQPMQGAIERVQREVRNEFVADPQFLGIINHISARGAEAAQVYVAEIAENAVLPEGGFWYPVQDLPNLGSFTQHQYPFVAEAARYFERRNNPQERVSHLLSS